VNATRTSRTPSARRFIAQRALGSVTAALVAALLLSPRGLAQDAPPEPRLGFTVAPSPGATKMTIGLPKPTGGSAEAKEFYEVLTRDLNLSGWFNIVDPAGYVEPAGTGIQLGQFRFEDWDVIGTTVLAKTSLSMSGGKLRAEAWVYAVPGREKLDAKAFTADVTKVRTLAHKVANEIILAVTGKQGPFNTRFAVVGKFGKNGNKEIYTVDFDGHGLSPVTKNGSINLQPSWDPGAGRIAFTSYLSGNPDLYVADLGKGRITRLSSRSGINTGATWAPGGGRIALTLSPGGDPDIYAIDANSGAELARLTKASGIDVSPSYSPDGSKIAFVSDRSGGAHIYVANADGSDPRRVTFQGSQNTDPSWSPDGRSLVFVSREGNFDIFTVRLDGSGLTRITQGQGDNEDPSFSPDGYYIAFSSTRAGGGHIWLSTADGAHQVQLTQGGGGYSNPAWSPSLPW
jgi:TolB protein